MSLTRSRYIKLLKNRDFSLLFATTFVGQMASAFLVLSLIVSNYERTQSSYAVSGVILAFTIPGFFLMAFAGLAADVFDRRKIILIANSFIALVVFTILFFKGRVIASTLLSSLYFAGNTFFLPAAQAATGQLAGKKHILISNVYFVFTFAGGIILGFIATSIVQFFWSYSVSLWVCFALLTTAAVMSYFLPTMIPKKRKSFSFWATVRDVLRTFGYIFGRKLIWFYFVVFAAAQGIIAFAATIAPGFFKEVVGLSFERALIVVFPLVGIGAVAGGALVNFVRKGEAYFVILGMILMAAAFLMLGGFLKFDAEAKVMVYMVTAIFLIVIGVGDLIVILASRMALQSRIAHNYQGTVFGANIILSSVMSSVLSLAGAQTVRTLGYVNTLFFGGVAMLLGTLAVAFLVWKWVYARS